MNRYFPFLVGGVLAGVVIAVAVTYLTPLFSSAPAPPEPATPPAVKPVHPFGRLWLPSGMIGTDLAGAALLQSMVYVPGGEFWMGDDAQMMNGQPAFPDAPRRQVSLDGFWIDRTEVTNAQFERFVAASGYRTTAERTPRLEDFPPEVQAHIKKENVVLEAGSIVFMPPARPVSLDNHYGWQHYIPGACWRQPLGPGSSIEGLENHPVVHMSWEDAAAYARWAGKRLPSEAEWERAARGGLDRKAYTWGNDLPGKDGRWQANIWQGRFPRENTREDGYYRTAPVGSFPANGYGLHDMAGNVWEWCNDWYRPDYYLKSPVRNPQGPEDSHDPLEPGIPKRVQRGGSFLCSDLYCVRYRPGTRGKGEVLSSHSHVGFRCAR